MAMSQQKTLTTIDLYPTGGISHEMELLHTSYLEQNHVLTEQFHFSPAQANLILLQPIESEQLNRRIITKIVQLEIVCG